MRRIRAISPERYSALIKKLGLSQRAAARFLGIDERTSRSMASGQARVDPATAMLLELMVKHGICPEDALRSIGISVKAAVKRAKEYDPNAAPRFYEDRRGA